MFEKEIVIDGRGHMFGRLASKIAKELLNGQRIVVVRCELINRSGSLFRNKLKWSQFLRFGINTNPRRGFKHHHQPSRMLWRAIRGMLKHKSSRGKAALDHLKVFDGIPYPYDHKKRMVVPEALKVLRLKANSKHCVLGDIAQLGGWTRKHIIENLEEQRKVKSLKFHELKQKKAAARAKAMNDKTVAKFNTELAKYGF
mmetsp:Transcript_51673/g.70965  ORF Transcript_51673/g.70965 Transcript_51673/m.70965 type:complete len:199 (-) Transcript_51673:127-723(-)